MYTMEFQKISDATRELAIGQGDIKERLSAASHYFWALQASDLPIEVKQLIDDVIERLTRKETVRKTLRTMHFNTAQKIVIDILHIKTLIESASKEES